jgi:hypothetical protein
LDVLDQWVGKWVAIKDDKVIAVSDTSRGLAYELHKLGPRAAGAVTEFVRPSQDDTYAVGAG